MKTCSRCRESKPIDMFAENRTKSDGRNYICRDCQRISSRKHYLRNLDKVQRRTETNRKNAVHLNCEYIEKYLTEHSCVDCGNNNPIVLDFDHVRGEKIASLSEMKKDGWSLKAIIEEIDKCEVRCANCHRIRHHNERLNATVAQG